MPACQISFAAIALAAQQAATPCTPPVIHAAPAVVAHPVAADGGECTFSRSHLLRRLDRSRALYDGRAVARWGVDIDGVVVLYRSRARAFNNAARHSYARFVEVCQ